MTEYHVLDLFAGLGGFSSAFEFSQRWRVTAADIDPEYEPDLVGDIFEMRPSEFGGEYDVILASPPCTAFSTATNMNPGEHVIDGDAIALAHHAVGLIEGLKPTYWFLENPVGHLRKFLGMPQGTVTYCEYGTDYQKPTDLWGDHPAHFTYKRCPPRADCHASASHVENTHAMPRDPAKRAKVPYELSEAIRDACRAGLAEEPGAQTTFDQLPHSHD